MAQGPYLHIALPTPLRRLFHYRVPPGVDAATLAPGMRVRVPFGHQQLLGILVRVSTHSDLPPEQLRPALAVIDQKAVVPSEVLSAVLWAARYYQSPPGEALHTALPVLLRQGEADQLRPQTVWALTHEGKGLPEGALKRAPKQAALLSALQRHPHLNKEDLDALEINRATVKALEDKALVTAFEHWPEVAHETRILAEPPLTLNNEQREALAQIATEGFQVSLLDGATGSGKTEIYLQAIERVLAQGRQALVLVPEIGLTPQTLARFKARFAQPVVAMHSGLNDRERLDAWLMARSGQARIVIGTRSAIFAPLAQPGILIVDEEHDTSFKQQDGFRYNARDLAVVRAHKLGIPLIMGTATPSLETLHNARTGRYQHLRLTARAGNARAPAIHLQDIRRQPLDSGFSQSTLDAIGAALADGNQALVFLNRRGYAPTLMCHDCGWLAECSHCDTRMTVHQSPRHLHCHHCDHQRALPQRCPNCKSSRLQVQGQGTERSEERLQQLFPEYPVLRIDRDSTRGKNRLHNLLTQIHKGEPGILVGTQMLAKGHHFPKVTLVVILDADAGLFSADFRGPERMGQLLLQVAGRAGRAEDPGEVILQSHYTEHPLVLTLMRQGYHPFADLILQERRATRLPPFRHLVLIRAESKRPENAADFLQVARRESEQLLPPSPKASYVGPLPAPMEKRGGRFRYQLQVGADRRQDLQTILPTLAERLEQSPLGKRVRWSIDVDPQEQS
ncbi:primosomal protein N' [Marinimicrobium alkaliphilum]|uniref:primosomal protein N' n=1 Tax=Marinimicrobium alkaliphilum TaxID=2202654 RepID=UPI000DBA5FE9|nr:primosomal protein N' [Marinimicrobium alkaliphilum]